MVHASDVSGEGEIPSWGHQRPANINALRITDEFSSVRATCFSEATKHMSIWSIRNVELMWSGALISRLLLWGLVGNAKHMPFSGTGKGVLDTFCHPFVRKSMNHKQTECSWCHWSCSDTHDSRHWPHCYHGPQLLIFSVFHSALLILVFQMDCLVTKSGLTESNIVLYILC